MLWLSPSSKSTTTPNPIEEDIALVQVVIPVDIYMYAHTSYYWLPDRNLHTLTMLSLISDRPETVE